MALDAHHFPTFDRIGRRTAWLTGWLMRNVFTERGVLRFILYALLGLTSVNIASDRYLEANFGRQPGPGVWVNGRLMPSPWRVPNEGVIGRTHEITVILLGETGSESSVVIFAICLAGLAVGTRPFSGESAGRWWTNGRALPRAQVTGGSMDLANDPPMTTPEPTPPRHPLDPDPDDPPLEPLWPNRSRPSR